MSKETSGLFNGTSGVKSSDQKNTVEGISGKESQIREITNIVIPNLPKNPDFLMEDGWEETTPQGMKDNSNSRTFHDPETGADVRFDKGEEGADGFRGKDHYHVENPNSTGKKDRYLDKNGNPCAKGSKASHILPKED